MLSNNKGFFLLELLLSLSAWFMLGMFFFPLLVDLSNQSLQLEVDKMAKKLLFNELHANLIDNQAFSSYTLVQNGVEYKLHWRESEVPNQKEVCVEIEKKYHTKSVLCAKPE
jgi:hypothetical protein